MFCKRFWFIYSFDHIKYCQIYIFYFIGYTYSTKWVSYSITGIDILPLQSPKSVQYTVRSALYARTNAVCYIFTLNPRFLVSIDLGRNLCWHVVLSWCCTTITALLFHYAPNISYLLVRGSNILTNKASSL